MNRAPGTGRVRLHIRLSLPFVLALLVLALPPLQAGGATAWQETRFHTGCDPGPIKDPPPEDPAAEIGDTIDPGGPQATQVDVDLATLDPSSAPLLGSGFNMENAIWSCPAFHPLLQQELLGPFHPALVRVDTGLLPAAPPVLPALSLTPSVYSSMLSSPPYAASWDFMRQLNAAGVKIVLGVWGGPAQFTQNGTRLGVLSPRYYDAYVTYVKSLVDFVVRQQGVKVWAITVANEPDGGDGNEISPDGLAYIARHLGPQIAPYGVGLYGPDTNNPGDAIQYLTPLLSDPNIARYMSFVSFHSYEADTRVADVVRFTQAHAPRLPVVVTEYTSYAYGDLDTGDVASDPLGFAVDIADMALSHYQNGASAALYWDAVDYLQPGHNALTRWGLLRGPAQQFEPRMRYYGLQQVLSYLQPGAQLLTLRQQGGDGIRTLAVRLADGGSALFAVNRTDEPDALAIQLHGGAGQQLPNYLYATETDSNDKAANKGALVLQDGAGVIALPADSVVTLVAPRAS